MNNVLISRDTKGKCRVVTLSCTKSENVEEYTITRFSGLLGGKMIAHTPLVITKGKVKRSVAEQAELEYNSHLKKYLDKGYKTLSELGCASLAEFKKKQHMLAASKTDAKGVGKPMLCNVYDKDNKKLKDKTWYASVKLDGVRCAIYMKDGELHTSSRGGQNYDVAATYILDDAFIKSLFEKDPDLVLDGELYHHGWNLQKISGLCRLEELHEDHKQLRFNCYDIMDESQSFKQRLEYLESIVPSRNSLLTMVEHVQVKGHDNIIKLHDDFVAKGYEGLVLRDPDALYKCGGRSNSMVKLKMFKEDSFVITGFELGLRGVEDMCFVLQTSEGKTFKAKPIGEKSVKEQYINEIEDIIGRKGDVKYFNITPDGIPNLPVFLAVRYDI